MPYYTGEGVFPVPGRFLENQAMHDGQSTMSITFRGVRGSYPMPGPTTLRYGGNTTCQEIRVGGRLIILDAGTGIIALGKDLVRHNNAADHTMALFFSHNHHDHTDGLLYFQPAYNPATTLHIFGPEEKPGSILETLEGLSAPAAHPVQLARMGMRFTIGILNDGDVVRWSPGEPSPCAISPEDPIGPDDVVVRTMKSDLHPVDGVLVFRIEYGGRAYVYATDVEGDEVNGDTKLAAFTRGADLLAHDGQYTSEEYRDRRRGWGHSTIAMAIRTAELAGVPRLAIIHHEPSYSDDRLDAMAAQAIPQFPGLFFARENQTIRL